MPRKLKYPFIFLSLIFAGWGVAFLYHQSEKYSLSKNQLRTITSVKNNSTIAMEKHLMPITIDLQSAEEIPEGPNELVTIKALIRTPFEGLGHITYSWNIPSDVEVVQGYINDTIANPLAGKTYEVELLLKNFDKQYRKEISLKASVIGPEGQVLSNARVITSRPEDSMEHLAPVMMAKAREAALENRAPASVSVEESTTSESLQSSD